MDLAKALSSLLGSSLLHVYGHRYLSTDGAIEELQRLCFLFERGALELDCAGDGWSIEVRQPESPGLGQRLDMGEAGSLEWVDVSGTRRYRKMVGRTLGAASVIVSEDLPIGAQLVFGDWDVRVLNWGDDLVILDPGEEIGTDGEFEIEHCPVS